MAKVANGETHTT